MSCGGLGYLSPGSGTWASLVALFFWRALHLHLGMGVWDLSIIAAVLLILGVVCIRRLPSDKFEKDDSKIVIDEWLGMGIVMIPSNFGWSQVVVAFLLFRFFDITKILGIRFFDRRYLGGWGVMLDDVLAGLYGAVIIGVWNAKLFG